MLEQVGDPFRITHVRLAARHRLDVLRIDHQQRKGILQQMVDGFPKNPPDVANGKRCRLTRAEGQGLTRKTTRICCSST